MNVIDSFTGQYRWLSNFYPAPIPSRDGGQYASSEHAFQAAKCADPLGRVAFREVGKLTPGQAKRLGRIVEIRPDWEDVKVDVMRSALRLKFREGGTLAQLLLETGDAKLVEGNTWGDRFWGVCDGQGENWLGKLLMERRDELRAG